MKREAVVGSPSTSPTLGHRSKKLKKSTSNGSNVNQLDNISAPAPSLLGLSDALDNQNAFSSLIKQPVANIKVDGATDVSDWSKVDRRKAKKARKTEEKLTVGLLAVRRISKLSSSLFSQNNPPVFFYNNSAIEQRSEAITIGVRA